MQQNKAFSQQFVQLKPSSFHVLACFIRCNAATFEIPS